MTTEPKITLQTIAKQANLSIASVSRVLHTPHLTTQATQTRVYQAIKTLNYDRQYLFKSSKNALPTKKILILDNQLVSPSAINRGIEYSLKKGDYKIFYLRFLYCNQTDIHQIINYTINHSFDGILIINNVPYLEKLHQYRQALPPIVIINHFSLNFPCIYFDHLTIGYQVTSYFLNQGHTRIAILLGDENKVSAQQLEKGYQHALLRTNLSINSHYIIYHCFHYQNGKQAIKTLMTSSHPPTAIIITDNIDLNYMDDEYLTPQNYLSPYSQVHGVIKQCEEMKIAIPQQLSLIYFNHDKQKQNNELDLLSAINKPLYTMGENAVNLLLKLLGLGSKLDTINQQMETTTIFRHST